MGGGRWGNRLWINQTSYPPTFSTAAAAATTCFRTSAEACKTSAAANQPLRRSRVSRLTTGLIPLLRRAAGFMAVLSVRNRAASRKRDLTPAEFMSFSSLSLSRLDAAAPPPHNACSHRSMKRVSASRSHSSFTSQEKVGRVLVLLQHLKFTRICYLTKFFLPGNHAAL